MLSEIPVAQDLMLEGPYIRDAYSHVDLYIPIFEVPPEDYSNVLSRQDLYTELTDYSKVPKKQEKCAVLYSKCH